MARQKQDAEQVRQRILAAAVELLAEEFEAMTMKGLAAELGMSIGYLYKYFRGKDEIYLTLLNQFHQAFYDRLLEALGRHPDPAGKVEGFIRAYFGQACQHYAMYRLIMRPPRVLTDYLGGEMEVLAIAQHQARLRWMDLAKATLAGYSAVRGKTFDLASLDAKFLFIFSHLHGLVEHNHSRILPYLSSDVDAMREQQLQLLTRFALE